MPNRVPVFNWRLSQKAFPPKGIKMALLPAQRNYMTFGESGLIAALIALWCASIVVAAKAYTPAYAFHAYLFAAASAAAIFAIFNRYFERDPEPVPAEIGGK